MIDGIPIEVRVEMDDREARRLMAELALRGRKLPLRRIGTIGHASIQRNFRDEGRPEKWEPIEREGKILSDTGRLRQSLNIRTIPPDNVEIGTDLFYAKFHQFAEMNRSIPARPFAMWQTEDVKKIVDVLYDHLLNGGRGSVS